ncbi:hypothetical protein SDC9_77055 [bioreactor metagenome]|uniref:DUF5723 domain-containing protein n=1 Tax=bioreactor metagenome TaxID=1076179 RepID=A0A644YPI7_9ZZZZ
MTRIALFFLVFIAAVVVSAQNRKFPEIRVRSVNALESKTLTDDFFGKYYFGKYIDSTTKWDAISRLDDKNHLGFFSNNEIKLEFPSEKKTSFVIAATHQSILGVEFTKDLFQLVFTGNNSLVGQHVYTNPCTLNQYNFSGIMAGVSYKITDNFSAYAYAGPVLTYNSTQLDFSGSSFFTSQAADSLALYLNGSYKRSGGPAYIKGIGFSIEAGAEGDFGGYKWRISASNLGRTWMNHRSISSQRDTLMYFTGIEVSDLSGFSAVINQELDKFEEGFSLKGDTGNSVVSLPLLLTAECRKASGKLRTDLLVLYYNLPGFFPYIQLTPSWPLTTALRVSFPIKYGGYGSINAGPGIEFVVADRITAGLEIPSLLSVLNITDNLSYNITGKLIFKITDHASLL